MTATLRLLSAGSIRRGVTAVMQLFEGSAGARVDAQFSSAPKVRERVLAGETADVVIASKSALDTLAGQSRIDVASRTVIGRTTMAVAIHKDRTIPDLSTTDAFREALLAAEKVLYNQGSSGAHAAAVIDQLGLREPLGTRFCVVQNGAEMFGKITSSPGTVLGLAHVTNIVDQMAKGEPVALAGRFPAEIQHATQYDAAVAAGAEHPQLAGAFVRLFASPEGRQHLAASGLD